MDPIFHESRPVLPRPLAYAMAAVLLATSAFMAVSRYAMGVDMPGWALPAVTVVFLVIIVLTFVLRYEVTVRDDGIEVLHCHKRTRVPTDEVLDRRAGELALIKRYDGWNLMGVKQKAFTAVGDDDGVAVKLTGYRVLVLSTARPDELEAAIPVAPDQGE